jgi:hypothetical protein
MTMANVYGWEIVLDEDLVVQWAGGNAVPEVISGGTQNGRQVAYPSIIGIMSIGMGWIVNTEPGYSTWFTGSPNYFIDGAVPLTATVPSSWWPDEVQMNWKITKIGEPVTFPAGTPFCFFNVYKDETVKEVEFDVHNIWDDEELMTSRMEYGELKSKTMTEKPWTWVRGIKTGIDASGKNIGPAYLGLPTLQCPGYNIDSSTLSTEERNEV